MYKVVLLIALSLITGSASASASPSNSSAKPSSPLPCALPAIGLVLLLGLATMRPGTDSS